MGVLNPLNIAGNKLASAFSDTATKVHSKKVIEGDEELSDKDLANLGIAEKDFAGLRMERQVYQSNKLLKDEVQAKEQEKVNALNKIQTGDALLEIQRKRLKAGGRQKTLLSEGVKTNPTNTKPTLLGV